MTGKRSRDGLRVLQFSAGDLVFLALVSVLTTLTMHVVHETGWPFLVCMLVGMAAAMIVQTLLAIGVAPLLGSIESMVPSMMIAMIAPMSVCTLHLCGWKPMAAACATIGAVFGVGLFVFVRGYGAACRAAMQKRYPQG